MSEQISHAAPKVPPAIILKSIERRPDGDYVDPVLASPDTPNEEKQYRSVSALRAFENSLPGPNSDLGPLRPLFAGLAMGQPEIGRAHV